MRFESGIDYENYLRLYNYNDIASTEYVYWLLSISHKYIFDSFPLFVFIISFITILLKLFIIYKISYNKAFATFIYICISYIYIDMGLIRQSLALTFFILSFYSLLQEKKQLSFLFFIMAFFSHHSAIAMLYVYFIGKKKIRLLYPISLLLAFVVGSSNMIFDIIAVIVNNESFNSLFAYASWKINFYLGNEDYLASTINIYIFRFFFLSLMFYMYRKSLNMDYFIKLYMIGTMLIVLTSFNIQFYSRIGVFMILFEIIIMSKWINLFLGWKKVIIGFIFILFYSLMFFRTSYLFEIYKVGLF